MDLLNRVVVFAAVLLSGCTHDIATSPDTFSVDRAMAVRFSKSSAVTLGNAYTGGSPIAMPVEQHTYIVDLKQMTDTAIVMLRRALETQGVEVPAQGGKPITLRVREPSTAFWMVALSPRFEAAIVLDAEFDDGTVVSASSMNQSPISVQRAYEGAIVFALNKLLADKKLATYLGVAIPDAFRPAVVAPAVTPPGVPAAAPASGRFPQVGDSWTYQLIERHRGATRSRNYIAKVVSSSEGKISEQVALGHEKVAERTHTKGRYLVTDGVSILSPYLAVFEDLFAGLGMNDVVTRNALDCTGRNFCTVSGQVTGKETVQVPAGSFEAIKVTLKQTWLNPSTPNWGAPSRDLTGWYAPEVKRFVKFTSRPTGGDAPDFDLVLTSYELR